jgi:hypothetical protein
MAARPEIVAISTQIRRVRVALDETDAINTPNTYAYLRRKLHWLRETAFLERFSVVCHAIPHELDQCVLPIDRVQQRPFDKNVA